MELFLLTGFLGAGKTTLLKNLIRMFSGLRMYIIVNEFGRESVDAPLARELGQEVAEINNGSIFCSCKLPRFEESLKTAARSGCDVIFVEASGFSDPLAVADILGDGAFGAIDYRGAICVADAARLEKALALAPVCEKQIRAADIVLLNKRDLVEQAELGRLTELIRSIRQGIPVYPTERCDIASEWLAELSPSGPILGTVRGIKTLGLQKLELEADGGATLARITDFLNLFCPSTDRVKGFLKLEGVAYLADCVGGSVSVEPYGPPLKAGTSVNRLTALAGPSLPMRRAFYEADSAVPGVVRIAETDGE